MSIYMIVYIKNKFKKHAVDVDTILKSVYTITTLFAKERWFWKGHKDTRLISINSVSFVKIIHAWKTCDVPLFFLFWKSREFFLWLSCSAHTEPPRIIIPLKYFFLTKNIMLLYSNNNIFFKNNLTYMQNNIAILYKLLVHLLSASRKTEF